MSNTRIDKPSVTFQQAQAPTRDGADLKRGRVLGPKDAARYGRGHTRDGSSRAANLVKGAKLALSGGVQNLLYSHLERQGFGGNTQLTLEKKADATLNKAKDGLALLKSALGNSKLDSKVASSIKAREAKHAQRRLEHKEAKRNEKSMAKARSAAFYKKMEEG